jgi:hypothetical protein
MRDTRAVSLSPLIVVDVPERHRYELRHGATVVAAADYSHDRGVVTVPHVETAPEHRGHGHAAALMAGILDDLRARQMRIEPTCPYAAAYLADHPDDADLLAPRM